MGKRRHLIAFRAEKGLTQEQMAKMCKVSLSTYHAIENGKQDGKLKFWDTIKNKFKLTGEIICNLQEKQQTHES